MLNVYVYTQRLFGLECTIGVSELKVIRGSLVAKSPKYVYSVLPE